MPAEPQVSRSVGGRRPLALLFLIVVALAAWQVASFARRDVPAWGWDESMHAELPAARMLLHAREGGVREAFDVLLGCEQYPFVQPVLLAVSQGLFGLSEAVARWTTMGLWFVVGLVGLALVGLELARRIVERDPAGPWKIELVALIPLFAAACPLAGRYAGTLFLEIPALVAATFALRAWLRRKQEGLDAPEHRWRARRRDLAAGVWVMLAFFTKFNYGALLAAGLAADLAAETFERAREGKLRAQLARLPWIAAVPVLGLAWWFVLPFPGGADVAASHRTAFLGFLGGNQGMARTPGDMRILFWAGGFAPGPIALALLGAGVVASTLLLKKQPVVRTLWILLLVTGPPVWFHNFQLDRFLIPGGLAVWSLAAVGWRGLFEPAELGPGARWAAGGALALSTVVGALIFPAGALAGSIGFLSIKKEVREHQLSVLEETMVLGGSIPTAGLERAEFDALIDILAPHIGPSERVAWIGMSSEVSPAALHLALLERGGDVERFLSDAGEPMDVVPVPGAAEREYSEDWLAAAAASFDVIVITDPPDLKGRSNRDHFRDKWHAPLINALGYEAQRRGFVEVSRPLQDPLEVGVYTLRRP